MEGQAHAGLQICTFLSLLSLPALVREGLGVFSFSLSGKIFLVEDNLSGKWKFYKQRFILKRSWFNFIQGKAAIAQQAVALENATRPVF